MCQSDKLSRIISLGELVFSGIFPSSAEEQVPSGELALTLCSNCSLLQLEDSFDRNLLYGDNYGYRSGLNSSMVDHLEDISRKLSKLVNLKDSDCVVDIASNDGTLLKTYANKSLVKFGIDPTSSKFLQYYDDLTLTVADFFPSEAATKLIGDYRARIVTSIAMLYDLENPIEFALGIFEILADDGVWHFEQSYMPWMVRTGAYDTICHEHIEYYSLTSISYMLKNSGFYILDVELNDINGGSIAVTARKGDFKESHNNPYVKWLLDEEESQRLDSTTYFEMFVRKVIDHRDRLQNLLSNIRAGGSKIAGLGASTKGSILLQYSGIDTGDLIGIGDINPYKDGRFMAGTRVLITSESEILNSEAEYFLVLPWHFKETFKALAKMPHFEGKKLIFPLPEIEVFKA